jgi:hypothetical protein
VFCFPCSNRNAKQKQNASKKMHNGQKKFRGRVSCKLFYGVGCFCILYKYKFLAFLLCFALCIHYLFFRLACRKYAIISIYPVFTDTLSVIKCNKNNSLVVQNFVEYLFIALLCRFCPMKCRKQTLMHLGSGEVHLGV